MGLVVCIKSIRIKHFGGLEALNQIPTVSNILQKWANIEFSVELVVSFLHEASKCFLIPCAAAWRNASEEYEWTCGDIDLVIILHVPSFTLFLCRSWCFIWFVWIRSIFFAFALGRFIVSFASLWSCSRFLRFSRLLRFHWLQILAATFLFA